LPRTPAGTSGTIEVPVTGDSVVTVNGRTVWRHGTGSAHQAGQATAADGYLRLTVPHGTYEVTVKHG